MIRWRDPRVPLTTAAVIGVVGLVAAFVSGASAVVVGAVAGVIAATAAAISLFAAAAKVADRRRAMAWRWLASGSLTWMVGIGVRPLADGTPFAVTFADLMLLVGTAMIAVSTGLCATRPAHGHALLRDLADGYVCAASVFVITWVLLLDPVYREGGAGSWSPSPHRCSA
ncbi:hypothetical protein ACFQX6_53045 [Streptosporangium lutulentum]